METLLLLRIQNTGAAFPFLFVLAVQSQNTFTLQGWTYLMGDQMKLKAVATNTADADFLTPHGGFTIPFVATETPG